MPTYSKAHERDENRLMNKAFSSSLIALLLCWLPVVGLAFAISGFLRMAVRLTHKHRLKRILLTAFSTIVMLTSIGVLGLEIYEYARNPEVLNDGVRYVWNAMTGEDPPWETGEIGDSGYNDYGDYGFDPYAYDPASDPDADEGYDSDFDDDELAEFPEDDEADMPEKDLFDQMIAEQKSGAGRRP